MYKKQKVFQKILTGVIAFIVIMAPMYVTRISVALNERIEREKKIAKTVSISKTKSNASLDISNKIAKIMENMEEDVITLKEISLLNNVGGGADEPNLEITFSVPDEVLYNVLINNYDAVSTGNDKELRMTNNHVKFVYNVKKEGDKIKDISGLENLTALESIELNNNEIKDISKLNNLVNLKYLSIESNGITTIPSLANLANLKKLDIADNNIQNITNLRDLDLTELIANKNQITDIGALSNLTNLETLNLANNSINSLGVIVNLVNLKDLNLENTSLMSIKDIGNLTSLEKLNLGGNFEINDWNTELFAKTEDNKSYKLINLKELILFQTSTEKDKDKVKLSKLSVFTNLETLNLSKNYIQSIDSSILKLEKLKNLNLSGNLISDISPLVGTLKYNYWEEMEDLNLVEALSSANLSKDTEDGLRRVFVKTPVIPYDEGDLFLNNQDIYVCNKTKKTGTYEASDFTKLEANEENSSLISFVNKTNAIVGTSIKTQADGNYTVWYKAGAPTVLIAPANSWGSESLKLGHFGDLYYDKNTGECYIYRYNGVEDVEHVDFENSKISKIEDLRLNDNKIEKIDCLEYMKNTITHLELSKNKISYTWVFEKLYKLDKENLYVKNQECEYGIMKKENTTVEYNSILEDMIQNCKNPSSKIYEEGANFIVEGAGVLNNRDFVLPNNQTKNYNQNGYYNIIFPENAQKDDTVTVRIIGGRADGSIFTYTIRNGMGDKIYDSIVCEDYNLYTKIRKNLDNLKVPYSAIPYIIEIESKQHSNIKTLDLSGSNEYPEEKIKNVKGLESLIKTTTLLLSTNSISSDNDISKINYIKDMPCLENLRMQNNLLTDVNVISNTKTLKSVNFAGNQITNIDAFTQWKEMLATNKAQSKLINIVLSGNQITDISPLSDINTLIALDLSVNKIKDISPIASAKGLTTLDFSNNMVEDISVIQNFTGLSQLSFATNKVKDLSPIKNLKSLQHLDISDNKITSLADLNSMYSLAELKANNNKISTIKDIANLNNLKNTTEVYEQKIFHGLSKTDTGIVTIDLPEIFAESKQNNILEINDKAFIYTKCTPVGDNKVEVNVEELGNEIATVEIQDGSAAGTHFIIGKEAISTVQYSTNEFTNEDVVVTVTFTDPSIKISNNDGKNTYTFTKNEKFIFEYENEQGIFGEIVAEVTWIDKEAPVITGVEDGKQYKDGATPVVADENIDKIELTKDGVKVQNFEIGTQIMEEGSYVLVATDKAGNKTTVNFAIGDNVVIPTGEIEVSFNGYEEQTQDNKNYVVGIQPKTTVKQLKDKTQTNGTIEIFDKNNKKIETENAIIASGYVLKITKGEESKEENFWMSHIL